MVRSTKQTTHNKRKPSEHHENEPLLQHTKKQKQNNGHSHTVENTAELVDRRVLNDVTNTANADTTQTKRTIVKAHRKFVSKQIDDTTVQLINSNTDNTQNDDLQTVDESTTPLLIASSSSDSSLEFSTNISDYVNSSSSANSSAVTVSPNTSDISRSEQFFSPAEFSILAQPSPNVIQSTTHITQLQPTVIAHALHIHDFDHSILKHIFSYVSKLDIIHISQTCMQWYTHAQTPEYNYNTILKQYSVDHQLFYNLKKRDHSVRIYDYMSMQTDFTIKMRRILMDWLLQVNNEFSNDISTMSLTVRLCDCFLSTAFISRGKIQLAGVACLLIASKLIETHYPDLNELMYLCDQIYRREQLIVMESDVMRRLKHRLQVPNTIEFIRILYKSIPPKCDNPQITLQLCIYIVELSFLEYDLSLLPTALLATAAYMWACYQSRASDHILVDIYEFTQYSVTELNPVIQRLNMVLFDSETTELQHIQRRYSKKDRLYVALTTCNTAFTLCDSPVGHVRKTNWQERNDSIGTQRTEGRLD